MKKLLLTSALTLTMAIASFSGVIAETQSVTKDSAEEYTFKDFQQEMGSSIKKADLDKIKAQFTKATAMEKNAMESFNKLYSMDIFKDFEGEGYEDAVIVDGAEEVTAEVTDEDMNTITECTEEFTEETFEDFAKMLKDDLSKKKLAEVKALYEKANKLEDDSMKIWDEIYKDLDIAEEDNHK